MERVKNDCPPVAFDDLGRISRIKFEGPIPAVHSNFGRISRAFEDTHSLIMQKSMSELQPICHQRHPLNL
jgi:hypothetical protein